MPLVVSREGNGLANFADSADLANLLFLLVFRFLLENSDRMAAKPYTERD